MDYAKIFLFALFLWGFTYLGTHCWVGCTTTDMMAEGSVATRLTYVNGTLNQSGMNSLIDTNPQQGIISGTVSFFTTGINQVLNFVTWGANLLVQPSNILAKYGFPSEIGYIVQLAFAFIGMYWVAMMIRGVKL